jgi:purine nucleosidase
VRRRVILDTDLGSDVDDAIALTLALASPEIDLVAVTTVSRGAPLRARIARRLLDLGGRTDVPVFAGCERPRAGGDPFVWFGNEGAGILEPEGLAAPRAAGEHAVDALARLLRGADDLEVCAVGPLTNLGELVARHPDAVRRITRLTVMGGHLGVVAYGGATFSHGVDYNLCADPAATVATLTAGVPVRLVTADVTLRTWLTPDDVGALAAAGSPLLDAVVRAIARWTPIMRSLFSGWGARMGDDNAAFLHDPLALACVYDEGFCTFEDLHVETVVRDGVLRTIPHAQPTATARTMRCATDVDAPRFRTHLVERLLRLAG